MAAVKQHPDDGTQLQAGDRPKGGVFNGAEAGTPKFSLNPNQITTFAEV
ncbi:MAG: hypothetical protein PF590_06785 [Candidatus Delongbacteria bacterium]|jgi:hypothetical protein|nr:hypothetical protein [Candidatus Delongbacteria bacterium]